MIIEASKEEIKNVQSVFLRFFVLEDYKSEPITLRIYGETEEIYTLYVTNKGWYSVDVTDYVKKQKKARFHLEETNASHHIKIASSQSENPPEIYISKEEDEFDLLRKKFAYKEEDYEGLDSHDVIKMVGLVSENADKLIEKFDVTKKAVFHDLPLSNDLTGIIGENQLIDIEGKATKEVRAKGIAINNTRTSYLRLSILLKAYHTGKCRYYKDVSLYDRIKEGLRLLYEVNYNPEVPENGNWWPWEIGIPKTLGEMILTMYDDLSYKDRMDYIYAIYRFQPNPKYSYYNRNTEENTVFLPHESVGANRVDTSLGDLLIGIAAKNPYLIREAVAALDSVYEYVHKGDGFYKDGSFVQHGSIAYTTGYGMVLVEGLIDLYSKLKDSTYKITNPNFNHLYDWLEESFIPMVYNGEAFPITGGRGITRQNGSDEWGQTFGLGYKIARLLFAAAEDAPVVKKEKFLALSRRFMEKNKFYDVKANASNIKMLREYEELKKIKMAEPYLFSKVYPKMDRVVHLREDYAIGLSMYSSRIKNFEMMNGENLRGWNQGNGTLYLLHGESGQYDDAFWPTVDSYHLAGTTVDEVNRLSEDFKEEFFMDSDFVGGVTLDHFISVAAMKLAPPIRNSETAYSTGLRACKSWFFFDECIVALGSGISASDDRKVKTTVENRMIRKDASNKLTINGHEELVDISDQPVLFRSVSFMHLEPSLGYYFPEPVNIYGIREERSGSWKSINKDYSDKIIKRNFVKFWFDHGINPDNESYSYAVLPGKTEKETMDYADHPGYEVMENSESAQAIHHKDSGILAANVFHGSGFDFGEISVDKPCSFIYKKNGVPSSLVISDPTMKLRESITVIIKKDKNDYMEYCVSLKGTEGMAVKVF